MIQLRRSAPTGANGTGRTVSVRYPCRGHWRRVWCGPIGGQRYQRAVYIPWRIKGPEGAPLIRREHINALVR